MIDAGFRPRQSKEIIKRFLNTHRLDPTLEDSGQIA